jgi:predicted O-methyltransferase YrrM
MHKTVRRRRGSVLKVKNRYDIKLAVAEMKLPGPVKEFRQRASKLAAERDDGWATLSTQRAMGVHNLLKLAKGRRNVVELGTASGWTAAALALTDDARTVTTFDPTDRPNRADYWGLLEPSVQERITYFEEDGALGAKRVKNVDFMFLDSSHDYEPTVAEFNAWRPQLAPGAVVVFDDFGHPAYPGVARAVRELELTGEAAVGHFIWRAPA